MKDVLCLLGGTEMILHLREFVDFMYVIEKFYYENASCSCQSFVHNKTPGGQ